MADVEATRKRLGETLRDRMQKYWDLMKDWHKRKISKDEFDSKAKFLLGENNLYLHNEFLFALLAKCQTGSLPPQPVALAAVSPVSSSPPEQELLHPSPPTFQPIPSSPPFVPASLKPPKPKKPRVTPYAELPYGALDTTRYIEAPKVQLLPRDLDTILLCTHDFALPDLPTMHTRMLLGAWELGLDAVSEESAQMLILALQYYLKNIIQSLITSQTSWISKQGTNFQHSFGRGPSSTKRSSAHLSRQSWGDGGMERKGAMMEGVQEAEAIRTASRSGPIRELEPLNLFHLRDALRVSRHCVPVHSVYSFNMERILAGMWHPSQEEEEQRKAVEQWKKSLEKDTPFAIPAAANFGRR